VEEVKREVRGQARGQARCSGPKGLSLDGRQGPIASRADWEGGSFASDGVHWSVAGVSTGLAGQRSNVRPHLP